jgi:MscS family membrane protein
MIFVDKPFQIGDWVSGNNIDGTVEEVGFRSTRIRTFRDSVQYVPNGTIADLIIDNHGERNYRRFNTSIGLTYDTSTEKIQHFVDDLKKIILDHPKTIKTNYQVHLNKFSASSLDILFYVFFKVDDWSEELAVRHEIMLEIIRKAEQLEVKFAFPSQSLYVEQMPLPKLKRD